MERTIQAMKITINYKDGELFRVTKVCSLYFDIDVVAHYDILTSVKKVVREAKKKTSYFNNSSITVELLEADTFITEDYSRYIITPDSLEERSFNGSIYEEIGVQSYKVEDNKGIVNAIMLKLTTDLENIKRTYKTSSK